MWAEARAEDRHGRVGAAGPDLRQKGDAEAALVGRAIAGVPEVRVVEVDPKLYDPIIQALGIVAATARTADAEQFARFVLGDEGQGILKEFGFTRADAELPAAEHAVKPK